MRSHRARYVLVLSAVAGLLLGAVCAVSPRPADARACIAPAELQRIASQWRSGQAVTPPHPTSMAQALCMQTAFVRAIGIGSRTIGYKVALTAPRPQAKFHWHHPISGVLLDAMLLPSGSAVPAHFGAQPLWEDDLLVVVGDDGINAARTPLQALQHLRAMRPFIELPDLAVAKSTPLNVMSLVALNSGARSGVAGREVPLPHTQAMVDAFASMRVVTSDQDGNVVTHTTGRAVLGNPLNSVVFLIGQLHAQGVMLHAGDVISTGSAFGRPRIVGKTITETYYGMPTTPRVSVTFR